MSVLARYGVAIVGPIHDTMLQSYVLNSVATANMDALAGYYLDRKTIHYEDVAGKGVKQLTFNQVPLETAGDYAAEDADITLQLHHCLFPQLQAQPSLLSVYNDIDMPLVRLLSQVERQGALVDGRMLKQHGAELADRLNELTQEVWALAEKAQSRQSCQIAEHSLRQDDLLVLKNAGRAAINSRSCASWI